MYGSSQSFSGVSVCTFSISISRRRRSHNRYALTTNSRICSVRLTRSWISAFWIANPTFDASARIRSGTIPRIRLLATVRTTPIVAKA